MQVLKMVCIMTKVRKKLLLGSKKMEVEIVSLLILMQIDLKLEDPHGGGLSVVFLTKRHWMTFSMRSSSLSLSASV